MALRDIVGGSHVQLEGDEGGNWWRMLWRCFRVRVVEDDEEVYQGRCFVSGRLPLERSSGDTDLPCDYDSLDL